MAFEHVICCHFAGKNNYFVILLACLLMFSTKSYGQGDGPRAYWPAPKGTDIVAPIYSHVNSNSTFDNTLYVAKADFDTNIYGLMYTHVFEIAGRTAAAVGMLSYGNTQGGIRNIFEGESKGLADTYLIGLINLYGAPAVNGEGYIKTSYDKILDVIIGIRAPTGEYDSEKSINIGTNRWEFKLGFPMIKFFNWGTTKVTSIEVLPSISVFTSNNDISNGDELKQDALFNLEGHVTQKLSKIFWGSFDYQYRYGAQANVDGISQGNKINSLAIGATLGADINPKFGGYITYGRIVATTDDGINGDILKILFSYKF